MTDTEPDFEQADNLVEIKLTSLAEVKLLNPRLRGEENLLRAYKLLRSREEMADQIEFLKKQLNSAHRRTLKLEKHVETCKLYIDKLTRHTTNQEDAIQRMYNRFKELLYLADTKDWAEGDGDILEEVSNLLTSVKRRREQVGDPDLLVKDDER